MLYQLLTKETLLHAVSSPGHLNGCRQPLEKQMLWVTLQWTGIPFREGRRGGGVGVAIVQVASCYRNRFNPLSPKSNQRQISPHRRVQSWNFQTIIHTSHKNVIQSSPADRVYLNLQIISTKIPLVLASGYARRQNIFCLLKGLCHRLLAYL